eukprot:XP_001705369.1 Hypothetical protein GL50803_32613 [Giardia lamblia ATCC 50803]
MLYAWVNNPENEKSYPQHVLIQYFTNPKHRDIKLVRLRKGYSPLTDR